MLVILAVVMWFIFDACPSEMKTAWPWISWSMSLVACIAAMILVWLVERGVV